MRAELRVNNIHSYPLTLDVKELSYNKQSLSLGRGAVSQPALYQGVNWLSVLLNDLNIALFESVEKVVCGQNRDLVFFDIHYSPVTCIHLSWFCSSELAYPGEDRVPVILKTPNNMESHFKPGLGESTFWTARHPIFANSALTLRLPTYQVTVEFENRFWVSPVRV